MLYGYAERVTTVKLNVENYVDNTFEPHPKRKALMGSSSE